MDSPPEFGAALLTNETGLHARPSVKLTQMAKSFAAGVELGLSADGPWLDAKRPVQVMRAKANKGETLYFRAAGSDACRRSRRLSRSSRAALAKRRKKRRRFCARAPRAMIEPFAEEKSARFGAALPGRGGAP